MDGSSQERYRCATYESNVQYCNDITEWHPCSALALTVAETSLQREKMTPKMNLCETRSLATTFRSSSSSAASPPSRLLPSSAFFFCDSSSGWQFNMKSFGLSFSLKIESFAGKSPLIKKCSKWLLDSRHL